MPDIKSKILVIDDEPQIRKMLKVILEADNYKFEPAEKGEEGIRLTSSLKPDLIILDLGLPDIDGLDIIPQIREFTNTPIVVLSARDQDETVAEALDIGADDYITKPFSADVLLARLRANLRKAAREESGSANINNGYIEMDLLKHEVKVGGEVVSLSPKEYDLLKYFINNMGKMLTQKQILKEVWGPAHGEDSQYLRVYIGQLRQKIEPNPEKPTYIITEPGIGYRMDKIIDDVS
jgi:two-component system KDP operon response regulator KdpE